MDKITSKGLLKLMDCKKLFQLDNLSMKGGNNRNLCFKQALGKLVERYVEKASWEEVSGGIRSFLEESYLEEWFLLRWQKVNAVERDLALLERFWQWLPSMREGVEFRYRFPVEVECGLSICDEDIRTIQGCVDLLTVENGKLHGYVFCRKFYRPYSYRARKTEHKVTGSIELLTAYEGLRQAYPEVQTIDVSLVRMVSSADKADCLAPFETKKGDNVVTLTGEMVQKECPDGIISHIRTLVDSSAPAECKDCRYHQSLCRRANKVGKIPTPEREDDDPGRKMELSEAQKKVIAHKTGPLRVCAGPGSGKTAVLVERVKKLITDGVPPERILAVTFTKKAAQEMAERIVMDGPVVSTLHALAFGILTNYEYLLGSVKLASKVDCKNLLVKILDYAPVIAGVSYEGLTMKYGLITALMKDFEFIEKQGTDAYRSAFPKKDAEGVLRVKEIYDEAFHANGYITFDDQITMAVRVLKDYPGILDDVRAKFDYIMVDEVQDLDAAQAEFVSLLAADKSPNLMICGDSDQSIYGFRGGSNQFMLEFPQRYPDAGDIFLEENYRSSGEIVEAAAALISQNTKRVPVKAKTTYHTGFRAIYIPGFKESHMPDLIREICSKGYAYGDIAIIARTNAQLARLCEIADREAAKSGNAVPLEQPKYYLREDFAFQFLLSLLELKVKGMNQDAALYRLLSWMGVNVEKSDKSLSIYEDYAERKLIYAFDGEESNRYWLHEEKEPLVRAFGKIYLGLQVLNLPIRKAVTSLWENFQEEELNGEVAEMLLEMMYEKKVQNARQLHELMNAIVVFEDDKRIFYPGMDSSQVHLLTGHDAKGKEFPVVILYDMDEFESGEAEEDRRVLYVAMTRAKRVLFLLESYPGKSAAIRSIQEYITTNRRARYEE